MAKKSKKPTKKAKKTKKVKTPRIEENNIHDSQESESTNESVTINLNRELAKIRTKTIPLRNKKFDLEDELEQKKEDFDDILKYLSYEIQMEQNEIDEYEERIAEIETKMKGEEEEYSKQFQLHEGKYAKLKETLEGQKYENMLTVAIMAHFKRERAIYLGIDKELREKEEEQWLRHKKDNYEEEKSTIIEIENIRSSSAKKVAEIEKILKMHMEKTSSIEEMVREYKCLEIEVDNLDNQLHKLSEIYDQLRKKESDIKIDLQLIGERKLIVKRSLKKMEEELYRVRDIQEPKQDMVEWTMKEFDTVSVMSINVKSSERLTDTMEDFIYDVMVALKEAIDINKVTVEKEEVEEGCSEPSSTDRENTAEDDLYDLQLSMINKLAADMDDRLADQKPDHDDEPPLPAIRNKTEYIHTGRIAVNSEDFMRNWKEPRFAAKERLGQLTGIPIADLLYTEFSSKFIRKC